MFSDRKVKTKKDRLKKVEDEEWCYLNFIDSALHAIRQSVEFLFFQTAHLLKLYVEEEQQEINSFSFITASILFTINWKLNHK